MKLSNNALNFLLAQYRAIFKRAYVKGLASAVILTAGLGLAAGQAQSATTDDDFWVTTDDSSWNPIKAPADSLTYKRFAGGHDDGKTDGHDSGVVSGENLVIGSSGAGGDIQTMTSGSAYGGYVSIASNSAGATLDAKAIGNVLTVKSGANIAITAHSDNLVGGWAKTNGSGVALAQDNKLIINAQEGVTLTSANQFIGGVAAGNNGATAQGNTNQFTGNAKTPNALNNTNGFIGGLVFVGDSANSGSKGSFEALGNSLEMSNFSVSGDTSTTGNKTFLGGNIEVLGLAANNTIEVLRAKGNTVNLNNFTLGAASYQTNYDVANIAANYVHNESGSVALVEANGEGETGVVLSGGTIYGASVFGGMAQNISGGSATASNNSVQITDTNLMISKSGSAVNNIYNGVFGGHAESTITSNDQKIALTANNNTVTLKANDPTKTKYVQGSIRGAELMLTSGASGINDLVGSTLTADDNTITVGEGIEVSNGSIQGVYLGTGNNDDGKPTITSGGAKLQANNNLVTVDGKWTSSENANIATVIAEAGLLTAENNKLVINGTVDGRNAALIAAVVASKQEAIDGKLDKDDAVHHLSNNSVLISADAEVTEANIYAAQSTETSAHTLNNDVTIAGKVTNSSIYGGTGADSLVDVQATSRLTFNKGTSEKAPGAFSISSDVVNLAGIVDVGQYDTVQVKGFVTDGNNNAGTYNTNATTVADTAKLYNRGTVEFLGQTKVETGAQLHALTEGARLKVNGAVGQPSIIKEDHTLGYEMVGGRGQLTIAEAQLKSYLTSGDNYTLDKASDKDKAGTVEVTSGGTLAFSDTTAVVLSDYNFTKDGTSTKGGVIVVDESTGESIFKAKELTVAHALSTNAAEWTKEANNLGENGVVLEANTLNLGALNLNSSDSAEILFKEARVKENINFLAATSGKDTGTIDTDDLNDGYHLTTEVIGSNFMKTNDQNSELDYYTALDGNVNGQVKIVSDGQLTIADGHWTAHDQITVASGGKLVVGDQSKAESLDNSASLPDATLATSGVVLDVSDTVSDIADAATLQAIGSGTRTVEMGDARNVVLDLTSGLSMQGDIDSEGKETIVGKAKIEATNNGVVLMNASDVNTILGQNHTDTTGAAGAFFTASNQGVLQVDGDVTATFEDFDGKDETSGFNLANTGILDVTTLTVRNANVEPATGSSYQDDSAYIAEDHAIEFVGTVRADDLVLNDEKLTVKSGGTTSYASQVKVASGTMEVAKSLSSVNGTVVLGDAAGSSAAHLVLNSDTVSGEGTVSVDLLRVDSGSVTVENGTWTARDLTLSGANTSLTVGGDDGVDVNEDDTAANLTLNKLTMGQGSTFNVEADGTATVASADLSGLNAAGAVSVSGVLNINGATVEGDTTNGVKFSTTEGAIRIENNGSLRFGSLATNGAILADGNYTGTTITLNPGYTEIANDGGELYLDFASGSSFDSDAIIALKNALFTAGSFSDGMLKNGGILNIGNASFEGFNITERLEGEGLDGYAADWSDVKSFSDIYGNDTTNNVKNQTHVRNIGLVDQVKGSWGSLSMESGVADGALVTIAGNTWLNYAAGNNGFFISNADHSSPLGAAVQSQKVLYLIGGGEIGRITLENGKGDVERNLTTLDISEGETTIESITGVVDGSTTGTYDTRVNVRSNTNVTGKDGITDVGEVNVLNGATLTTTKADLADLFVEESIANITGTLTVDGVNGDDNYGEALALGGQINAGSIVLEHHSDLTAVHGGTITAKTVSVANNSSGSMISIGTDIATITETISPEHENSYYNGTGYFEVSDYLELNDATLVVDPAYDENTSVAAVMNFKSGSDKTYDTVFNDVGIINGSVLVGKNAALGIGATLAETREAIATYQQNGALDANKYGSLLYLNGQLTLDGDSEIALNSDAKVTTLEGIRDSLKYTITSQVQDQYADLGLGANTAILMTEAAFEDADGNKNGVAITFDRTNAVVNGAGGDIVLVGAFDAAQTLNFFKDNDGEGHQGAYIAGQDIKVYTQNGFLFTTLKAGTEAGYGEVLHVDKERAYQVMSEASDPVVATLISYHEDRLPQNGGSGDTDEEQGDTIPWTEIQDPNTSDPKTAQVEPIANENVDLTPIEPPVNNAPTTKVTGSSTFLNEVVTASHGAPAEQAARLGVYGGSAQVGLAASNSNADVLASRFGIGANAQSLNLATNGMGGTLWVAPIYKSQDSDGFAAQGLNYGVDFDLYGVALGGDYKVTNEITVGAMFNVGSGDLDGQGNTAASGVSNDFDYFGFGLYGAYQAGALTVTADLSFTQVDNDLEGNNELGKVSASADTTAWSLGVTGQYQFTFASIDVTPHAGLRFTSLDLDDYGVNAAGHGTVANFDSDTMSVFSIPVGVTFAKSFKSETWTVTPALDLHVTGQFGDDEAEGAVSWSGTNLSTSVTSEVFDNFTYGATVGVEAQSVSGFSFGLGLGYTGSSNVDEFSAQANARFTF